MRSIFFGKEPDTLLFESKEAKILTLNGKVRQTTGVASARGECIAASSWLPARGAKLVLGIPGIVTATFSGACRYPGPHLVIPRQGRVLIRLLLHQKEGVWFSAKRT